MNRKKKIAKNIIILIIVSLIFFLKSGIYISPISAHEHSERSIHYGPSEIVHIEDFDDGKYFLCKYDKWVSCNTVNKTLFFFWRFGDQPVGFENDTNKKIDYTWGWSDGINKIYGIINDNNVKKIEIDLLNGKSFTISDFYDNLFLLTWKSNSDEWGISKLRGLDANNNIIYNHDFE